MHDSDRGWSPEAPPAVSPSCRARGSQSHTFHPSRVSGTNPPPPKGQGHPGLPPAQQASPRHIRRPTLTAYSMLVALWTQRLHTE